MSKSKKQKPTKKAKVRKIQVVGEPEDVAGVDTDAAAPDTAPQGAPTAPTGADDAAPGPVDATGDAAQQGADVAPTPKARRPRKERPPREPDPRMPPVGTVIQKKDRTGNVRCECQVVEGGVLYNGTTYKSLSAAALASARDLGLATKTVDGWSWWGLKARPAHATKRNPVESLAKAFQKYRDRAEAIAKSAGPEDLPKVGEAIQQHVTALQQIAAGAVQA
jgi:hypothetical protein